MNRGEEMCFCWIVFVFTLPGVRLKGPTCNTGKCPWIYRRCAVQCEEKQARSAQAAERAELRCVPRPTSGAQEQGAGLESVQIGLMRFPSTPSACQGPSGFLPAYLDCI